MVGSKCRMPLGHGLRCVALGAPAQLGHGVQIFGVSMNCRRNPTRAGSRPPEHRASNSGGLLPPSSRALSHRIKVFLSGFPLSCLPLPRFTSRLVEILRNKIEHHVALRRGRIQAEPQSLRIADREAGSDPDLVKPRPFLSTTVQASFCQASICSAIAGTSAGVADFHCTPIVSNTNEGRVSFRTPHKVSKYFGLSRSCGGDLGKLFRAGCNSARFRASAVNRAAREAVPLARRIDCKRRATIAALVDPIALVRSRRKPQAIGQKHRMVGDSLGRGKILFHQCRRHGKRFGGVGETFARGAVGRELRAGCKSIPVRSRTVALYSALLKRRKAAGPGSPTRARASASSQSWVHEISQWRLRLSVVAWPWGAFPRRSASR